MTYILAILQFFTAIVFAIAVAKTEPDQETYAERAAKWPRIRLIGGCLACLFFFTALVLAFQ